jgi:hypothetical protein
MPSASNVVASFAGAVLLVCAFIVLVDRGTEKPTDSSTELYTAAGFEVVTYYKCIFPTCTDAWCNANCNHHPKYCPPSFCRLTSKQVPVAPQPTPPPAPTPEPTAGPATCPTGSILGTSWYTTAAEKSHTPVALICCPEECGTCAGVACGSRPGGSTNCCAQGVMPKNEACSSTGAGPCVLTTDMPAEATTTEMVAPSTELEASPTELAGVAPACDAIGQSAMCDEACVSTCRGLAPGFKVAGCATESYCTAAPPSWAKGSVCTCPPTKAPLVPTCDAADKSSLCSTACKSTCRGDTPGFKVAGCADQSYCTTPPSWAQTSLCSCPTAKPEPPPPPATSQGSCTAGIEGKVAAEFAQTVGGTKVCCPSSCGTCGGPGCASFPGGKDECCVGNGYEYGITAAKKSCSDNAPPCIIMGDTDAEA